MKVNINAVVPKWSPKKKFLNDRVSHYPSEIDPELELFHLSFKYYNDNECEINLLEKNRAKALLLNLKVIGRCYDFKSLKENNINLLSVKPEGEYKRLFTRNITEDVQLKEHKIQGTSRLFYFIVQNMFYIVAITNSHFETNKHR